MGDIKKIFYLWVNDELKVLSQSLGNELRKHLPANRKITIIGVLTKLSLCSF